MKVKVEMEWQRFAIVPILIAVVMAVYLHHRCAASMLGEWAEAQGLQVVERRLRLLFRGPFTWTASEGQAVYRVTVEDRSGRRRSGWVRCGDFAFGMFRKKVKVLWDEIEDDPATSMTDR